MTKRKVYYIVSLLLLTLPIFVYFLSLVSITTNTNAVPLLTIPSNFFTYTIADNSFFFMSRLANLIGIWDNGFVSSFVIGLDFFIWFSLLFAVADIFTLISDLVNIWRKDIK